MLQSPLSPLTTRQNMLDLVQAFDFVSFAVSSSHAEETAELGTWVKVAQCDVPEQVNVKWHGQIWYCTFSSLRESYYREPVFSTLCIWSAKCHTEWKCMDTVKTATRISTSEHLHLLKSMNTNSLHRSEKASHKIFEPRSSHSPEIQAKKSSFGQCSVCVWPRTTRIYPA